jgi:hypothetical protein
MEPIVFFLKKKFYKKLDNFFNKFRRYKENQFRKIYFSNYSAVEKIHVCLYQQGHNNHFTRFFTSSNAREHSFILVAQPAQADVVIFLNSIDDKVLKPNQGAILFFHEPLAYAYLYQSELNEKLFPKENLEVVSHLPTSSSFIKNADGIKHHRSIPYVHFHHGATYDQLNSIDEAKRTKLICSIATGLKGIPGYHNRRQFLENFSAQNLHFDLFGKFSESSASISAYRGQCISKWKVVSQYKYSLTIENSVEDYYISEKIFDALICGSMPIYYGSDKIFEILPKEWFYYLPSLDASEIDKLNAFIATDAYKIVSQNRAEICNFIYEKFGFFSALERLLTKQPLPVIAK